MIAVLDANIYISAFISPAGPPGQVVQALISGRFEARATERLWGEVTRVLEEPKIRAIFERRGDAARIVLAVDFARPPLQIVSPAAFLAELVHG
jgi:predicted nucleic acid-binding protein